MKNIWDRLYEEAKKVLCPRKVSSIVEAGGVAAAIEARSGKIYTGVCVDCACTLGICAERSAIFNMITCGESKIRRVIAVNSDGKAMPPCRRAELAASLCRRLCPKTIKTWKSCSITTKKKS